MESNTNNNTTNITSNNNTTSINTNTTNTTNTTSNNSNTYEDGKILFINTIQYEKQLKELRTGNIKENGSEISKILNTIRSNYHKLLVYYPQFCSSLSKDVDTLLWKSCFYKQIDEYRKSIKRTIDIIDNDDGNNIDTTSSVLLDKAKLHLLKLTAVFNNFLADSIAFYQDLMLQLENIYKTNTTNDNNITTTNTSTSTTILKFIHRCLLYLGDLLRYQELYAENKEKDYSESECYYRRAAFLLPSSGNPHNQLAALSSYMDVSCVAIYHSCRSVLVRNPFDTAIDNIKVFFEKNSRLYSHLDRDSNNTSSGDVDKSDKNDKSKKSTKTKQFFVRFLRIHGMLFEWTQSVLDLLNKTDIDSTTSSTTASTFKIDKFMKLFEVVMDEYETLLNASCFGEQILIKILIICLFSLHRGADITSTIRDKLYGNKKEYESSRCISESLALTVIFTIVNKTATRIDTIAKGNDKNADRDKFKKPPSAILKSLPLVSVFADWAGVHSQYLISIEPNNPTELSTLENSIVADYDILQKENRSRSGMRVTVTSLEDFLVSNQKSSSLKKDVYNKPLREHIELRGFLPLESLYENYFNQMDPLSKIPTPLSDEYAFECRLRTVQLFLQHSLMPTDTSNKRKSGTTNQSIGMHKGGLLPISTAVIKAVMKENSKSSKNNKEIGRKKKSKVRGDKNEMHAKRRASSALNDPDYNREYPSGQGNLNEQVANDEEEDDEEEDYEEDDDGADMSEQVADILMVQPQRPATQGSDALFFSNLGLLGSHSSNEISVPFNQIKTQEIHSVNMNIDDDDDDMDDVVVFKPAFSRTDFSISPSIPMDAEPYLPFAATRNFNSNGSLHEKWDIRGDDSVDLNWWGNEAADLINAGILDDNDVTIPLNMPPPPGLGYN